MPLLFVLLEENAPNTVSSGIHAPFNVFLRVIMGQHWCGQQFVFEFFERVLMLGGPYKIDILPGQII
jgi:hypothetical protein